MDGGRGGSPLGSGSPLYVSVAAVTMCLVTDDSEARPCSIPRAMLLDRLREQELEELREDLEYWGSEAAATSHGAGKCLPNVQALTARIDELESSADPVE